MPDEIYDTFDEEGNHTGTATWTEVHTKGLIHKAAAVLIFKDTARQKVLIQKRSEIMDQDPGKWAHSAGGHLLAGTTPDHGIRREIQEELFEGQSLPDIEVEHLFTFFQDEDIPNNREMLHVYRAFYGGPFFQGKEVAEIQWVKWDDLIDELENNPEKFTNSFRAILREYQKQP